MIDVTVSPSRIWRPYTQELTTAPPLELSGAFGSHLHARDGRRIFDGISSWWLTTHGHCHPALVEAVQLQAAKLDQVAFGDFTHEPAEELAETLVRATHHRFARVFLSDNGSTAVEVALKMALQGAEQTGGIGRTRFLAFEGAYHGDTVGAMSVSGESPYNRRYRRVLFDVIRAAHPRRSSASVDAWTEDFERQMAVHGSSIAGVIIEPLVQGAGGMIVWPEQALRRVADVCRHFGSYLIFDEVMTGFGRTGQLFAMDRIGVVPDMICLSKGLTGGVLPLAATLVSQSIFDAFLSLDRSRMLFHGHSFTGNPISCAAAVANLRLCLESGFLGRLKRLEHWQKDQLASFASKFQVHDPRVCGTVAAFDLSEEPGGYLAVDSRRVAAEALARGLFVRPLGGTVYLMPVLGSEREDLEQAWASLAASIEAARATKRRQ